MAETLHIDLHNRVQAWNDIKGQLFPFLAQVLQGGGRWVLTVARRKRTNPQNRRYWSKGVLAQVADQARVGGRQYPPEIWHELFKKMFIGVEELPDGTVIGKSSTGLSTIEFSEFCTRVEAYACSELNVTFYDLEPNQ